MVPNCPCQPYLDSHRQGLEKLCVPIPPSKQLPTDFRLALGSCTTEEPICQSAERRAQSRARTTAVKLSPAWASHNYLGQPSVQWCVPAWQHRAAETLRKDYSAPKGKQAIVLVISFGYFIVFFMSQAGLRCVCKWKFCSVTKVQLDAWLLCQGATSSLLPPPSYYFSLLTPGVSRTLLSGRNPFHLSR